MPLRRCQKVFENGKRCTKHLLPDEKKYCKKHQSLFPVTTYSVGHREFDGDNTRDRYESYIQSDQWKQKARREKSFQRACVLCHRTNNLHVHHSTYVRLGNEQLGDLIVVCENCHSIFHNFYEYDGRVGHFVPK